MFGSRGRRAVSKERARVEISRRVVTTLSSRQARRDVKMHYDVYNNLSCIWVNNSNDVNGLDCMGNGVLVFAALSPAASCRTQY